MTDTVERTGTRIVGFNLGELDFQLMRMLGAGNYGGAAPGEVFAARGGIANDDPEPWAAAFVPLARRLERMAEQAVDRHPVSARDHWLRASMYWRCAEYFADPFGAEARDWGLASRNAFRRAAPHLEAMCRPMPYTFEGRQLPGYWLQPRASSAPQSRPTLLVITGFDGTGEELYFHTARAGLERGFNVAIAEGPGQMGTLRDHPDLVFRPDYEAPISAMLDAVLAQPGVDPARLGLYGISFGGYFASRGAAHDARIGALIVNSPITDLHAYMVAFMGGAADEDDFSIEDLDDIPDAVFSRLNKHMFKAACRRFGVRGLHAWLACLQAFRVEDQLSGIRCPALAMYGTGEGGETARQVEAFCAGISGSITRHAFAELGSDMHCQLGNLPYSNAVVYDWLETLWS